jgi:mRNA interferase MazF
MAVVKRFDIYLVNLDAEITKDAKNTRPCVVLSPDEMNGNVGHVLVAPVSSGANAYPTRVPIDLLNSKRFIILDQIHAVDEERLVKKIGSIDKDTQNQVLDTLQEFFAE